MDALARDGCVAIAVTGDLNGNGSADVAIGSSHRVNAAAFDGDDGATSGTDEAASGRSSASPRSAT